VTAVQSILVFMDRTLAEREAVPGPRQGSGHCARCNRPLTNPLSIALGEGPICRTRKLKEARR